MKIKREITQKINWIFDNLIPPILRDSKLFMYPFMKVLFKDKMEIFMNFKDEVYNINYEKYYEIYKETKDVHISRKTDLNQKSIDYILDNIVGNGVLDIACGNGYLCNLLSKNYNVTGADVFDEKHINFRYVKTNIEETIFKDNEFDTVISAHTLEHILNIQKAVSELRRITKKRLIVVLPKQREYKYTFDLHLHFFSYRYNVLNLFKPKNSYKLFLVDGDWIYVENL